MRLHKPGSSAGGWGLRPLDPAPYVPSNVAVPVPVNLEKGLPGRKFKKMVKNPVPLLTKFYIPAIVILTRGLSEVGYRAGLSRRRSRVRAP